MLLEKCVLLGIRVFADALELVDRFGDIGTPDSSHIAKFSGTDLKPMNAKGKNLEGTTPYSLMNRPTVANFKKHKLRHLPFAAV